MSHAVRVSPSGRLLLSQTASLLHLSDTPGTTITDRDTITGLWAGDHVLVTRPNTTAAENDLSLSGQSGPWGNLKLFAGTPVIPLNKLPVTAETGLEAALATVDAEKIKKNLFWIAADARGGRDTPSAGQTETANFLRDQSLAFGWEGGGKPGDGPDSFFYTYQLWGGGFKLPKSLTSSKLSGSSITSDNGLSGLDMTERVTGLSLNDGVRNHDFTYGRDYFYSSLKEKGDVEITGDMVLVGQARAVDFKRIDVQGKWAVCLEDLTTSPEERRALAKQAGAKGLIILPHPDKRNPEQNYRLHKMACMARSGTLRYPIDSDFDEITFTHKGAKRLLPLIPLGASVDNGRSLTNLRVPLAGKQAITLTDTRVVETPFAAVNATNVVAFWKGSDPELSKEAIIISAHYDHLGEQGGRVFNGADDNGSGTATLVALAEAIAKLNPKRSVILMWVSVEEKGLLGSAAFAGNPYFPDGVKPIANLNMDMVGRNEDNKLFITPSKSHRYYNGLTKLYEQFAPLEGFTVLGSADNVWSRSDHAELIKLIGPDGQRIKVAFTTTGMHAQYHKTTDDADLINYPKMARIVRLDLRVLDALQAGKLDL